MSQASIWGQLKGGAAAGILAGGRPYARNIYYTGDNSPQFGGIVSASIQAAVDAMVDGDVLLLGPQEYNEDVVITGKNGITIVGASPALGTRLTGLPSNGIGLTIVGGQDVQLVNMNLEGRGTGGALKLMGQIRRLSALGCKFNGGAFGVLVAPAAGGQIVDFLMDECYFGPVTTGFSNALAGGDPTHRVVIKNSIFSAVVTDCIVSAGSCINIAVVNNIFGTHTDVEPTRFIKLDGAGDSGIVAGNQFATATNANTKFVLDADVYWTANGTEAGWSAARPA